MLALAKMFEYELNHCSKGERILMLTRYKFMIPAVQVWGTVIVTDGGSVIESSKQFISELNLNRPPPSTRVS